MSTSVATIVMKRNGHDIIYVLMCDLKVVCANRVSSIIRSITGGSTLKEKVEDKYLDLSQEYRVFAQLLDT